MPIYEYVCDSCRHQFEVKQKFSDEPISSCVRCGQAVKKIISAPAIMFKGSGWYVTDYSDKMKAPNESHSGEPPAKSTDGKPDGKTETSSSKTETATPAPSAPASSSNADTGSKPAATPAPPAAPASSS